MRPAQAGVRKKGAGYGFVKDRTIYALAMSCPGCLRTISGVGDRERLGTI